MTWARRLKKVFSIDISECKSAKGAVKIIACIEDPVVIRKILVHLKVRATEQESPTTLPPSRARRGCPVWIRDRETDKDTNTLKGRCGQRECRNTFVPGSEMGGF